MLISVQTPAAGGTAYAQFAAQWCQNGNGYLLNDTGTSLDVKIGADASPVAVASGKGFPFKLVYSCGELYVRRTDQSATQVTVEAQVGITVVPSEGGGTSGPVSAADITDLASGRGPLLTGTQAEARKAIKVGGSTITPLCPELLGIRDTLRAGVRSASIVYIGDSTANDIGDVPYRWAQMIAAKYPAYTVKTALWNTSGWYNTATTIQTGKAGEAYFDCDASGAMTIPGAKVATPTSGTLVFTLDGTRADWTSSPQWLAKQGTNDNAFKIWVSSSRIYFQWSEDGVTFGKTLTSTNLPGSFTAGSRQKVRITFVCSTSTITFDYWNGTAWTQISTNTLSAPATIFNSHAAWVIYGNGRYYSVSLTVGGGHIFPQLIGDWIDSTNTGHTTQGGAPELIVYSAAYAGYSVVNWTSDALLKTALASQINRCVVVSLGLNDLIWIDSGEDAYRSALLTKIKSFTPAGVVMVAQNPATSLFANWWHHHQRCGELPAWSTRNGCGFVSFYRAFIDVADWATSLISSDGTGAHPNAAGYTLCGEVLMEAMGDPV